MSDHSSEIRGGPARSSFVFGGPALFLAIYLASFFAGLFLRFPYTQWVAFAAVLVATVASIRLCEGGRWPLGLSVRTLHHFPVGVLLAVVLVGSADLAVIGSTPLQHGSGSGFPLRELAAIYLPAVCHEELLFRGYAFQKLWRWNRRVAILGVSAAFALLHGWNDWITPLALVNIFLGGVLLSLAYERFAGLWLPAGIHLGWNLMSGPVLGYPVSGFIPSDTILTVMGSGPSGLTGGPFGIEGSGLMTVIELAAIGAFAWSNARGRIERAE